VLWLVAALVLSGAGMSWFALAMPAHWQQVFAEPAARSLRGALRMLGAAAVLASAGCCLQADHASIAVLVWIMLNTGAGVAVTLTLAHRPELLRPLLPFKLRPRRA